MFNESKREVFHSGFALACSCRYQQVFKTLGFKTVFKLEAKSSYNEGLGFGFRAKSSYNEGREAYMCGSICMHAYRTELLCALRFRIPDAATAVQTLEQLQSGKLL